MKRLGIIALAVAMSVFMMGAFAQTSDAEDTETVDISAETLEAINLIVDTHLDFGTLADHSGVAGSLVVSAADHEAAADYTATNVTVVADPQHAEFSVSGENDQAYEVTLPDNATVTANETNLTVDAFTSNLTDDDGTLCVGGDDQFTVGATLNMIEDTPAATYNGDFDVTVDYQ